MSGWWSQRFAAEGAASADGIAKQLGRPNLDPLTILVREAAQNSWDARETSHIRFGVHLRRLGDDVSAWQRALLPSPVPDASLHLAQALRHDAYVLVVSDRGTRGLGGPLRADEAPPPGVTPDFVQFLRNVGEASDQEHGGGTYGFGKGIFYALSSTKAILVDTHCRHDLGTPRRFMGAALGPSFSNDAGVRFTGRHWWGEERDGIPYPLVAADADDQRQALGLSGFASDEYGTDIVVLDVDLGEVSDGEATRPRTPSEAGQFLASSILWNLWPKFGSSSRPEQVSFDVTVDGRQVPLPRPETVAELAGFVAARDRIDTDPTKSYMRRTEPKRAGDIALCLLPAQLRTEATPQLVSAAMPMSLPLRHVARMRVPDLVVDYVENALHPDPLLAYAGVFKASVDADRAFAKSEPPTHDDWVSAGLSGSDMGVVRYQKRFMKDAINEQFPRTSGGVSVSTEGLGRLSTKLASLIPGGRNADDAEVAPEEAVEPAPGRQGLRRSARRRRRAKLIDAGRLVLTPYGPRIEATVEVPEGELSIDLVATVTVVVEGGRLEDEAPMGAGKPRVLGWYPAGEAKWCPGDVLTIPPGGKSLWTVVVNHIPDAQVRLKVETEANDG